MHERPRVEEVVHALDDRAVDRALERDLGAETGFGGAALGREDGAVRDDDARVVQQLLDVRLAVEAAGADGEREELVAAEVVHLVDVQACACMCASVCWLGRQRGFDGRGVGLLVYLHAADGIAVVTQMPAACGTAGRGRAMKQHCRCAYACTATPDCPFAPHVASLMTSRKLIVQTEQFLHPGYPVLPRKLPQLCVRGGNFEKKMALHT